MTATALHFELYSDDSPRDFMARFLPGGKTVLNRTEWRGKGPRTCAVSKVKSRPRSMKDPGPTIVDVEVTYRPKGHITYVGNTRYDGWTALVLNRSKDGALLDSQGNPLKDGEPPVYVGYEVFEDMDFNQIDFGTFISEESVSDIKRTSHDEVMKRVMESGRFVSSIKSTFVAPRRNRPSVTIMLSSMQSATGVDGFGTRVVNINRFTPHLQQAVLDELTEAMNGYLEGRYSLTETSTDDFVFVEFNRILVDCTPNEQGEESRFNVLGEYVSSSAIEALAKRLMATYEVDISIVDGSNSGFLITRTSSRN